MEAVKLSASPQVVEDAIEIARAQGAVVRPHHYFEYDDHQELLNIDAKGVLVDPGDCKVCIAGALALAELRAGEPVTIGRLADLLMDAHVGLTRVGQHMSDIADDTEVVVAALKALR